MFLTALKNLWEYRCLLFSLVRREFQAQTRGSILGLIWFLLEPLGLLLIYTVVFHYFLGLTVSYRGEPQSFALYLFCGLLPYLAVSQAITRSSTVIRENTSLIKKIIFPSEILPLNLVFSALLQQFSGTVILLAGILLLKGSPGWKIIFFPLLLIPQVLLTAGISWLIASLGVFIRDTRQVVALLMVAWMFFTPIFYSENAVPEQFRLGLLLNPLAGLVSGYRALFLYDCWPDWIRLAGATGAGLVSFLIGLWWFSRTRQAFVDVI